MKQKKHAPTMRNLPLQDAIISVIVVSQNDQEYIEKVITEINKNLKKLQAHYEILIVDNNSDDKTVERIKKLTHTIPHIRTIVLSKKYANEIALTAGLDNCIGDYAVLFNMRTDPPEMITVLINKLLQGFDIVIGKSDKEFIKHGAFSKLLLNLVKRISTHEFYYRQEYLSALDRKAINSIIKTRRKSRNFGYIRSLIGFKKYTIEYEPIRNSRNKIKEENFFKLFFTVIDIVISNSFKPIRILTALGMFFSFLSLIYVFIIAIIDIFFNKHLAPQGWITISTVISMLFFLLFSLLTIMSEYIIRIVTESRNEPLYFISEEMDRSVILNKKDMLNVV